MKTTMYYYILIIIFNTETKNLFLNCSILKKKNCQKYFRVIIFCLQKNTEEIVDL